MARIATYWHAYPRKVDFLYCVQCQCVYSHHFPKERLGLRLYLDAFDPGRDLPLPVGECFRCAKMWRLYDLIQQAEERGEITSHEVSIMRTRVRRLMAPSYESENSYVS